MKHKKANIENTLLILVVLAIFAVPLFAAAMQYTPMEQIPGLGVSSDWCTYLSYIYKFGLWAVGIAALLMVSIGGFMYISSAGNNASMEKAKGVITDAVVGLVMALTAWLVLNTINPDLTKCALPDRMPVSAVPVESLPMGPSDTTGPTAATGICSDCQPVPQPPLICKTGASCTLPPDFIFKLSSVNSPVPWRITEAYPPTVPHQSSCHNNGTCADINLLGGATDVPSVKKLSDALTAAGFTSFTYESKNCAPYTEAGIKCKFYSTMTGSSFHVNNF